LSNLCAEGTGFQEMVIFDTNRHVFLLVCLISIIQSNQYDFKYKQLVCPK